MLFGFGESKAMKKVVVGMSGGVDSSVAAYLLKREGFHVIALFMKNWEDASCSSLGDFEDVVRVCDRLKIPYYSVNFVKEYWERVFSVCLKEYARGLTPNPDILCNREIKFKLFFEKALALGGDFLATGHYCRIGKKDGSLCLLKGVDLSKDQSYFLYTLPSSILPKVLFPLGSYHKQKVRAIAQEAGLATAKKKDSTGICFVGERDFKPFLQTYLPRCVGDIKTKSGRIVGRHDGVAFYTIGQRKGLGIGGPGEAWYVVSKDVEKNVLIVQQGEGEDLFSRSLVACDLHWILRAPLTPYACFAKVRYRQTDVPCVIEKIAQGKAFVRFQDPQRAVTLSQSIVFYDGDVCLGGGKIIGTEQAQALHHTL